MKTSNRITKSEQVYNALYTAVTEGTIPPKTKLTVKELAIEYNVSEIPVREALQRLSAEGLLVYTKYSGYEVPSPSIKQLRWLWEIKLGLELFAADMAVNNIGKTELETLQANIDQSNKAIKSGRFEDFEVLNKNFHMEIYNASGNPFLVKEIEKYWSLTVKIRGPYSFRKRNVWRSIDAHTVMLKAIREKDIEGLKKSIRTHREENFKYFEEAYLLAKDLFGKEDSI